MKFITPEEMMKKINSGECTPCHLMSPEEIFKPRGSMKKNSMGEYLFERLVSAFEEWTDPKYGDNPPVDELIQIICDNLRDECSAALEGFFNHAPVRYALSEKFKQANTLKGDL